MCKKYLLFLFVSSCCLYAQDIKRVSFKKEKLKSYLMLHYKNDVQKQKAVTFLIDNIAIQNSQNSHWVDANGNKVSYNELDYANPEEAVKIFNKLKDSLKITPKSYKLMDIDVLTPEFLIKNIDSAFDAWRNNPWSKSYDFNTFCEYILPYRSIVEPLEDWREEFKLLSEKRIHETPEKTVAVDVATSVILSVTNYKFLGSKPDPIPFLSPKQLLFRKEGTCNDLANLMVLACRSAGIAATFDFTPHYGASSNSHYWNTFVTETGKHIPFNGNSFGTATGLPYQYNPTTKRLAKVFRKTYSIQPTALASIHDSLSIPEGFLREKNTLDVTSEYVPTATVTYPVDKTTKATIGFLNVFNLTQWQTVDWGARKGDTIEFKNVGTRTVYLPSIYYPETKKMQYADYPILLDANKKQVLLQPNYSRTFSYTISKPENSKAATLDFNSFEVFDNKAFRLFVWDHGWKALEEAQSVNKTIHFSKMPDNGLFLVLCNNSGSYVRIFRINTSTEQIEWY